MHIKTARTSVLGSMILSVVCAGIGLVFFEPGTVASLYITFAAFGLMIVSIVVLFTLCRCPWCSKRVTHGLMKAEYCPYCKRDFDTGLKYRKKKK